MTELQIHGILVWAILAISVPTFLYLFYRTAPFGRHYPTAGWGPSFSNRTGWIVMELPTVAVFLYVYLCGESAWEVVPLAFLVMWQAHYLHRTFIFPFRLRTKDRHPRAFCPDRHLPVQAPDKRQADAGRSRRLGILLQRDQRLHQCPDCFGIRHIRHFLA